MFIIIIISFGFTTSKLNLNSNIKYQTEFNTGLMIFFKSANVIAKLIHN